MAAAIVQLGQGVLRRTARAVPARDIRRLRPFIRSMVNTMRRLRGVGIAAPQVGKSLRLFIIASRPSPRYPQAPQMVPLAMINPRILSRGRARNTSWEGCLSIPGIRGQVPRCNQLRVEFTDHAGQRRQARLTGFIARIFQHEFDHINGKVFLDRVTDTRTLITEKEYRRRMRNI